MKIPPTGCHVDLSIAHALLRVTLGLNILIHGVSRILMGVHNFAAMIVPMFDKTPLPTWSVQSFALTLPWAEFLIGFFILLGLRTRIALIAGSLLTLALTFGVCLRQDWANAELLMVYAFIYATLLALCSVDVYSADGFLRKKDGTR